MRFGKSYKRICSKKTEPTRDQTIHPAPNRQEEAITVRNEEISKLLIEGKKLVNAIIRLRSIISEWNGGLSA